MPLYGATFQDFGGLDLADAADENPGAIDMLNVDLDVRGRVRSRDGYTKFTTAAAASTYAFLVAPGHSANVILGITNASPVRAINATTGVLVVTSGNPAVALLNLAGYGAPGTTAVAYGGTGTATATILKFDGAAFSNVATGLIAGSYAYMVNVTPSDNRLMLIRFNGIAGTDPGSTIVFSNAGAPETFAAIGAGPPLTGPIVQLTPGDGEAITGVCNFANQTFVFKETKFFVFTGTATDSAGNPIFNYRTVAMGAGSSGYAPNGGCPCAGPDGVYFALSDGIYRTTGGTPQKISAAINPIFGVGGPLPPYFQGLAQGAGGAFTAFYQGRLYVTYRTTSGTHRAMLVFNTQTGDWMYSDVDAVGMVVNPADNRLVFAYGGNNAPTATNDLGEFNSTATTDAGTAISARYRSGYISFDYAGRTIKRGYQGVEKTIREAIVDGSGTPNFRLAKQWVQPANLPAGQALTLGTPPQVAQARDRRAVRGRMFSYQLDGTAPWTVEKVVLNLRDIAEPGLQKSGA